MLNMNAFFTKLGTDAVLLEAYKLDPYAVVKKHGLTDEEIEAMMSEDKARVSQLSGDKEMAMYMIISNPTS
jgi:hypothetical protein